MSVFQDDGVTGTCPKCAWTCTVRGPGAVAELALQLADHECAAAQ